MLTLLLIHSTTRLEKILNIEDKYGQRNIQPDLFVIVDPSNWKQLKEEEDKLGIF